MTQPVDALARIADTIRESDTLLGERVRETTETPVLGTLAASGPRAAGAEEDYAFVVEAIREGYLLHYGEPRLLEPADPDEALLAGDYLYALGLERLAGLGDLEAVRELADLISLCAQLHADGAPVSVADRLWQSTAEAVGGGSSQAHEEIKEAVRQGPAGSPE